MKKTLILIYLLVFSASTTFAQHSIAREWNEVLLEAIRSDLARPTVHARNLFHSSVLMYDSWSLFDENAESVFLGKTFGGYTCEFNGIDNSDDVVTDRNKMISYAMYRFLQQRFKDSPGADYVRYLSDQLMEKYGFRYSDNRRYEFGDYGALGNYLAYHLLRFGLEDGANEQNEYSNLYYKPKNDPLFVDRIQVGYPIDPNRWQPLSFNTFIDQSGNSLKSTPDFLGPEWGRVIPFALKTDDLDIKNNSLNSYLYNDPGPPDYIQDSDENGMDDPYKWGFSLVASWSAHLDATNPTTINISPGAIGNLRNEELPSSFEEYKQFYNFLNGGQPGNGHVVNPYTSQPYEDNIVKRADYARVLAEFWADGPDSETPPGHWFTILNYVSDNPLLEKRFEGTGPILNDLEWDVKCYLALGGAMHDAAINTWGIKGYYDYVRPISAIRYMAWKGQSSDKSLPSYDPHGLPLIPGLIEIIDQNDPLAQEDLNNVNKIKINTWRGHENIRFQGNRTAGVGWILGMRWWPYQRSTFVTPNFAGYLSGHSTFSRAASQVLERLTGDPFFPGGMASFVAEKDNFLVFEEGPSEDIVLQWATYKDASDQTSLSRIWGGIHPPIDDIRGRIIGEKIGNDAFDKASSYFSGEICADGCNTNIEIQLYPNPFNINLTIQSDDLVDFYLNLFSLDGKLIFNKQLRINSKNTTVNIPELAPGVYIASVVDKNGNNRIAKKLVKH